MDEAMKTMCMLLFGGVLCVAGVRGHAEPQVTTGPEANPNTQVTILCYHRFEERPRDGLAMTPKDFESQMQTLRDEGITVIPMEDFLAWRRGEKSIPDRAAIITIDDGYLSGYTTAWPVLKTFGYPFTMFIYTDYVKGGPRSGGQSLTWEQLAEMHAAGVDIGSHSISHASLPARKGRTPEEHAEWLRQEMAESKRMLGDNLGIEIKTFAYPYGNQNEEVRRAAEAAGYEAAFTVRGEKIVHGSGDPMALGRYAMDSTNPGVFAQAIGFGPRGLLAATAPASAPAGYGEDAATTPVSPAPGTTLAGPLPEISIDLSSMESLDPASLAVTVSGLGRVPATFDKTTAMLTCAPVARLHAPVVSVAVAGRAAGKKFEERWTYATDLAIPSLEETKPEM
jgi:peptidoglycan/xylan/chitin deacetylase (PgdA/CDA1 family)